MIWSPQQNAALQAVHKWLRARDHQIFRLFGYAGTGKTTLARHLAEGVDGDVAFATYTGKAAHVLRSKGCTDASTIHNLIYRRRFSIDEDDDELLFDLDRDSRARLMRLIVIDECSMVDEEMGHDLMSFGVPILVLGDPAQLPPVNGAGYFTDSAPDVLLTEIHRQMRDNPIIALSTIVREGGRLEPGEYGDARVIRGDCDRRAADQILVGRNRSRIIMNANLRSRFQRYGTYPVVGDKLVCTRNDYRRGLLNGSLWTVTAVCGHEGDDIILELRGDDNDSKTVVTHAGCFDNRKVPNIGYAEFDFGYVLTVHKAQGSQWDNVLLYDQSQHFPERARWLYTGITRAAKQITIVLR